MAQSIAKMLKALLVSGLLFLTSAVTACGYAPQMAWADGLPVTTMIGVTSSGTSAWIALSGLDVSQDFDPNKQERIQGTTDMMEESMLVPGGIPSVSKNVEQSLERASGLITGETQEQMMKQSSD
ncbi:hypothetical protein KQ302_06805 [Synechococcus sp. CS-602]|uniref:hypothetical protein n=2 Tax=Synechococcales TaxID=1890424 RepID=UPI000AA1F8D6|nr:MULTISPECIES: hypothetical protein [Synechococcaceae]MCT0202820.1 hypothetical protein [Synechococcus sp. CS-603]MCT4364665.1 hypothetical protein [Candidatus Regnicoccus frigidus MAG-AL1]MCT0204810.1 hypothetical protein [Synechococcus sp. CS-602]MCT0245046.1 hypothetical protein [Synechococcus sp. CS-601]MCT4368039.1 hypothetical protein [Candidatus Regnicoccus frigidus MAG-AL2]